MKKQPEAMRLASWLELRTNVMLQDRQAAAELRRLHALNAELLEALKAITQIEFSNWSDGEMRSIAKDAIAKAEVQQ